MTAEDPWEGILASARALNQAMEEGRRIAAASREARRKSPAARARRSAAGLAGWETRRAREAERAREDTPVSTGPVCGEMNHDSTGREVFCGLWPRHEDGDEPDCDNLYGTTWPTERYDD